MTMGRWYIHVSSIVATVVSSQRNIKRNTFVWDNLGSKRKSGGGACLAINCTPNLTARSTLKVVLDSRRPKVRVGAAGDRHFKSAGSVQEHLLPAACGDKSLRRT